jgi:hypothetical protein
LVKLIVPVLPGTQTVASSVTSVDQRHARITDKGWERHGVSWPKIHGLASR